MVGDAVPFTIYPLEMPPVEMPPALDNPGFQL